MKVIKTILDYYREINVPKPKYAFFHIGDYKDNLPTIKMRQDPIKHELFSISLMKHGVTDAKLHIHNKAVTFKLFIISPFKEISWDITGKQIEGRYIIFDQRFLQSNPLWQHFLVRFPYFRLDQINTDNIPEDILNSIDSYFEKISQEYYGDRPGQFDLIRSYVHTIFLLLNRYFSNTDQIGIPQHSNDQLLASFEELLVNVMADSTTSENFRQASFYARALNVHVNHLNATVKSLTGKTTSSLINAHVIQQAGLQLKQTNDTIKEIAARFQFSQPSHFISFFRKHTGKTPKQYKAGSEISSRFL